MMPGGGLVLENIHPSQEGVYQCLAENKIGRVTAEARVTVRERPVLTVTPETRVQVRLPPPPFLTSDINLKTVSQSFCAVSSSLF